MNSKEKKDSLKVDKARLEASDLDEMQRESLTALYNLFRNVRGLLFGKSEDKIKLKRLEQLEKKIVISLTNLCSHGRRTIYHRDKISSKSGSTNE